MSLIASGTPMTVNIGGLNTTLDTAVLTAYVDALSYITDITGFTNTTLQLRGFVGNTSLTDSAYPAIKFDTIAYPSFPFPTQQPSSLPWSNRTAPPQAFNRYINASDLLQEFIQWLGTQHVKAREIMQFPIELFVKWLVIRACEEDQEEPNVVLELPRRIYTRCLNCGRFMRKNAPVLLHPACSQRYFAKQGVAA